LPGPEPCLGGSSPAHRIPCPTSESHWVSDPTVWPYQFGPHHRRTGGLESHLMVVRVNRAPVMTLWAAVVAERLGFDEDEALTIGQAVAGLNAYAKGVRLGIYTPEPESLKEQRKKLEPKNVLQVDVLHRAVPVVRTEQGLRALHKGKAVFPAAVRRYLVSKFGEALPEVKAAMEELAGSLSREDLVHRAYELYEQFRPSVPPGVRGWGAPGDLELDKVRALGRVR
jgi:hypothetical protein